jgi:hypothetical protein
MNVPPRRSKTKILVDGGDPEDHLLGSFAIGAELATAPGKVWEEWATAGFPEPGKDLVYQGAERPGQKR